ncbi:hypothetical protein HMPREF9538_03849 [Klebsiella sp. MS 92-3]|nr:hypothetical protein HMPREF9538_03849 [Klebsiella sp. MS 92-3]
MGARWFGQNNYAGFFPACAALSRATCARSFVARKRRQPLSGTRRRR